MSGLSKAFERIVKKQICTYVNENRLLSPHQSGYRPAHSTKTAMLKVIDDIGVVLDEGNAVIMILLDYSKAFDTIAHSNLCQKLSSKFGFTEPAVDLIRSYLSNRHQAVFHNGILSSFLPIVSGVPQGSVLGPILFSLYINDLPSVIRHCEVHMFADDVQLYFYCHNLNVGQISSMINTDLKNLFNWSKTNSLQLNASKTNALHISHSGNISEQDYPELILGNERIAFVEHATSLGVIIDSKFDWSKHLLKQCGKIYAALRSLRCWASWLNSDTKLKVFKSYILPHFIAMDFLLPSASAAVIDRIRIALNCCVRFVYNLNRFARVTHLQKSLLGYSFYNFAKARVCIIIHKLLKSRTPEYLYSKLHYFRGMRLRKLVIPRHRTSHYAKTFFIRGVVYWNELPQEIIHENSTVMFRKRCLEQF